MESSLPPAESSPPLPTRAVRGERTRKFLWVASALALVTPLVWVAAILLWAFLATIFGVNGSWEREQWLFRIAAAVALVVSAGVARRGLRRDWHQRVAFLWSWSIAAPVVLALTVWAASAVQKMRQFSADKYLEGSLRQIAAAADQSFGEFPYRIFVPYHDLVGPTRYWKILKSYQGEDLGALFPIRRDLTDFDYWSLPLPDGRMFRTPHPPPEVRKPDGVDVVKFPDGGRFETTYRGGVADGPFRAYHADGTLWGEATYVKGRVVGPCWLYLRDGKKFDELKDGDAIERAMAGK